MTILSLNCKPELSSKVCTLGNLCGIASYTFWFVVLWPQILKNHKRRSVEGLSVLWATANFTASLVNCFFIFHDSQSITYFRIVAAYRAVVQLVILIQFWCYSKHNVLLKLYFACGCFLVWAGVVTLELSVAVSSVDKVQWIAVVLWSLETFPQIILNIKLRSTEGQAPASIHLSLLTKTLFFVFVCLVNSELQNVVMMYLSASLTYCNAVQVIWYSKPKPKRMIQVSYYGYGSNATPDEDLLEADECDDNPDTIGLSLEQSSEVEAPSLEELNSVASWKLYQWESYVNRVRGFSKLQIFVIAVWFIMLFILLIGLCLGVQSSIALFAPLVILFVMIMSLLYRDYKEKTLPCCQHRSDNGSRLL